MEKVNFILLNGKSRPMKRKMAEHLARVGKGFIEGTEPEADQAPKPKAADTVKAEAKALGIDLENVDGTGKDGRILKRDLHQYKTRMMTAES